jgi:hypothetical protein
MTGRRMHMRESTKESSEIHSFWIYNQPKLGVNPFVSKQSQMEGIGSIVRQVLRNKHGP